MKKTFFVLLMACQGLALAVAQEIGDRFKSGQPVIVNLQAVDKDLRRRLVDFASGLCYGLEGEMERVAE